MAAIGQNISFADMAKLCGLKDLERNGADTIGKWEAGDGPSGPVAALLSIFAYALIDRDIPDELISAGSGIFKDPAPVNNPQLLAEIIFREMMQAEVHRRLK